MSLASKERLPQLKLPMIPQREDGFVVGSMALPLPCPPTLAKPVEPPQTKTQRVVIARPFPSPPPVEFVNPDDTSRLLLLGYGSSAKVYKVRHRTTGKVYALKLVRVKQDASVRRQILRETHILQCARSPFIVACHGISDRGGEISFVLEFMDGGSLAHVLERRKTMPEPYLAEVARQVLQGLFYLHSNRIVHRDLKPSNLLLNGDRQVKIADFGVSTVLTSTLAPCNSFVGTCAYMSPERFDPDSYGGKYDGCSADIWSLGLTLLECFIGYFPFITPGQKADWPTLMVAICFGDPPTPPPTASSEFRSFVKHCLQKDASKRLSASQLLSHPFLTKYEENPCDLSTLMQALQI